ncbi:MAG: TraR/DksA C4-type zinc finger protein, partial [Spirochaetales bacterium]|nr:TraR/DksA C4-type zinc finger protein [Spirochaetales bacterium]
MTEENPRQEIEEAVAAGDLPKLLVISGMLHGHYCPYSALGVKAGARAMRELRTQSTGMEELVAIVETNNCFSDGIQIVTGCSFGNNALIFRDYGKTAFTLARRNGEGLRISVRADRVMEERSPEATQLFEKVVVERAGSEEEGRRLSSLWRQLSFQVIELPDEEVFDIQSVLIEVPSYARIFASATCSVCGESVMEPRARVRGGETLCLACSAQEYYQLAGDGITTVRRR